MTAENSRLAGQRPAGGSPGEILRLRQRPRAMVEDPATLAFSNDNAEFYERKIVTSKSKSYLMRFMDASYKLFK
jgi:hypothetical protein